MSILLDEVTLKQKITEITNTEDMISKVVALKQLVDLISKKYSDKKFEIERWNEEREGFFKTDHSLRVEKAKSKAKEDEKNENSKLARDYASELNKHISLIEWQRDRRLEILDKVIQLSKNCSDTFEELNNNYKVANLMIAWGYIKKDSTENDNPLVNLEQFKLNESNIVSEKEKIKKAAMVEIESLKSSYLSLETKVKAEVEENIERIKKECNEIIERINNDKNQSLQDLENETKSKYVNLETDLEDLFKKVFGTPSLFSQFKEWKGKIPDCNEYIDHEELPDYYYFGDVSLELGAVFLRYSDVAKVWIESEIIDSKNGKIKIPFMMERQKGYVLQMPKINSEIIDSLIFRNIISFPAGRIDLRIVSSGVDGYFARLHQIGGGDKRKIVGERGNYNKKSMVNDLIADIFEIISNNNNNYGSVTERENLVNTTTLILDGFQENFDKEALDTFMRFVNSANNAGVNIIILTDKETGYESRINHLIRVEGNCDKQYINVKGIQVKFEMPEAFLDAEWERIKNDYSSNIGKHDGARFTIEQLLPGLEGDLNNYFNGGDTANQLVIPTCYVGNKTFDIVLGQEQSENHHILISGACGSGKSELVHAILISAMFKYDPSELQYYLMDYKEGDEFNVYNGLPSIVEQVQQCDRSFGLQSLSNLKAEMIRRYNLFTYQSNRTGETIVDIQGYRNKTGENMPRILLVIEELSGLTSFINCGERQIDDVGRKSLNIIRELAQRGRAAGIHMVLTTQNPQDSQLNELDGTMSNIGIRFIKTNNGWTYKEVRSDTGRYNVDVVKELLINTVRSKDMARRVVEKLSSLNNESDNNIIINQGMVLSTNIADLADHPLNKFMIDESKDWRLYCGQTYEIDNNVYVRLASKLGNILMLSSPEVCVKLTTYSVLSLLLQGLRKEKLCGPRYITLFAPSSNKKEANTLNKLSERFQENVQFIIADESCDEDEYYEQMEIIKNGIDEVYSDLLRREGGDSDEEIRFVFLCGLERFTKMDNSNELVASRTIGSINQEAVNLWDKVRYIIEKGSVYNIFSIAFSDYIVSKNILEARNVKEIFGKILAVGVGNDCKELLKYEGPELSDDAYGIYHVEKFGTTDKIKLFDMPSEEWMDGFSKTFYEILG